MHYSTTPWLNVSAARYRGICKSSQQPQQEHDSYKEYQHITIIRAIKPQPQQEHDSYKEYQHLMIIQEIEPSNNQLVKLVVVVVI
jgi:hypothetical protein